MTTATPPAKGKMFFLRSPVSDFEKADPAMQPSEINGQACAYLWKDAIEAKRYVSRKKNLELKVTPDRMDGWLRAFSLMKQNGVRVPACLDHSDSARDCVGYIIDMQKRGDRLYLLHQFIGEDAHRMAARNDVSLGIMPDFEDGEGRRYGEAIVHSALTPVPVVPGQGRFVPSIAASRGGQSEEIVFELAASNLEFSMLTPDQVKQIRELGAADDVADDALLAWLINHATTTKGAQAALLSRATAAEAKANEIEPKLTAAKQEIVELSTAAPKATDPEVLHERSLRIGDRIKTLSNLKPADQEKLAKLVAGAAKPVLLSRNGDDEDCLAGQIVDFLSGVELAPKPGSKTGIQTLSRQLPADGDPGEADKAKELADIEKEAREWARSQAPARK